MKILIVAISQSIHTQRWVNQLRGSGHEVILFCSAPYVFPKAKREYSWCRVIDVKLNQRLRVTYLAEQTIRSLINVSFKGMSLMEYSLYREIRKIKPDLVHTISMQESAYALLTIKDRLENIGEMPKWLVTNWGSDIFYWRHDPHHHKQIVSILENCDYYSCENKRDLELAIQMGLKGKYFDPFPNAGGLDLATIYKLRNQKKTSDRKTILLKGYNNQWGRASVGLRAIKRCVEEIKNKGLKLVIHSADLPILSYASSLAEQHGFEFEILDYTSHQVMLEKYADARISIGLSLSDGNSTSLLEAIALGAFPIQSDTAAVEEWFEDGVTGIAVPAEEVDIIAAALKRAITDDVLVDNAQVLNWETTRLRLDYDKLKGKTLELYSAIEGGGSRSEYS